ncbi:unnamed protein product [Clonostachys solani]|uniref:Uncharacterized protein n=1 Tax=Clonostachys solani TaxID=160281 RepID=A0A9N9ZI52_9HYPO|nr:unnamed protein product [Clonostachys solani]
MIRLENSCNSRRIALSIGWEIIPLDLIPLDFFPYQHLIVVIKLRIIIKPGNLATGGKPPRPISGASQYGHASGRAQADRIKDTEEGSSRMNEAVHNAARLEERLQACNKYQMDAVQRTSTNPPQQIVVKPSEERKGIML